MGAFSSKSAVPSRVPPPVDVSMEIKESELRELKKRDYDFENLVLEGGGAKGTAYPGALQVLEECGILQRIKRFGGSSAGACVAGLLSLGYTPGHIASLLNIDQGAICNDARFGYWSLIPNLFNHYGWHPGKDYLKLLQLYVREATGDENYTFGQLYEERGKELCVVVSNISKMSVEYFHPKTTPDMPIAEAMRMSASIPGYFQPLSRDRNGQVSYYVDGGMLCNFPVHCFDGWFLSLAEKDSFFQRLGSDEDHFGTYNTKTIGMNLFSTDELDLLKNSQCADNIGTRPDTALARKRGPEMDRLVSEMKTKSAVTKAAKYRCKKLKKHDLDRDGRIDVREFKETMKEVGVKHPEYLRTLFGDSFSVDECFEEIDKNSDGQITFIEFMSYIEKKGTFIPLECILDISNSNITSLFEFAGALQETYNIFSQGRYVEEKDKARTIGIHTDYIRGLDLMLHEDDKKFLRQQGQMAAIAFLQNFGRGNPSSISMDKQAVSFSRS